MYILYIQNICNLYVNVNLYACPFQSYLFYFFGRNLFQKHSVKKRQTAKHQRKTAGKIFF